MKTMQQDITITVEADISPIRIDKFLADRIDRLSRSRIQQLIESQQVRVNGRPIERTKDKIGPGDTIQVFLPPLESCNVEPEPIPLNILYEDNDIAVINKQAGLCVHPTEHMKSGTLVNGLLHAIHDLSGIGGVLRPGIVHRLDRVTSGVIVIAKNDAAHQRMSDSFKNRRVQKTYWALAHGAIAKKEGKIDRPIGRHPNDRKRMTVRDDGRKSLTMYRILRTGLGGTLLAVYPRTGRTHQIRVHLRHLGLSIVRDRVYGLKKHLSKGTLERLFDGYPGIGLHAKSVRFEHPATGNEMFVEAPLPEIFQTAVDQMICPNLNSNV